MTEDVKEASPKGSWERVFFDKLSFVIPSADREMDLCGCSAIVKFKSNGEDGEEIDKSSVVESGTIKVSFNESSAGLLTSHVLFEESSQCFWVELQESAMFEKTLGLEKFLACLSADCLRLIKSKAVFFLPR